MASLLTPSSLASSPVVIAPAGAGDAGVAAGAAGAAGVAGVAGAGAAGAGSGPGRLDSSTASTRARASFATRSTSSSAAGLAVAGPRDATSQARTLSPSAAARCFQSASTSGGSFRLSCCSTTVTRRLPGEYPLRFQVCTPAADRQHGAGATGTGPWDSPLWTEAGAEFGQRSRQDRPPVATRETGGPWPQLGRLAQGQPEHLSSETARRQGQQPRAAAARQAGDRVRAAHHAGPQPTDQQTAGLAVGEGLQQQVQGGGGELGHRGAAAPLRVPGGGQQQEQGGRSVPGRLSCRRPPPAQPGRAAGQHGGRFG